MPTTPLDLRMPSSSAESASASATQEKRYYLSIDCGGTKTEAAIATGDHDIVARALGPTGNMAEVGLNRSAEIIKSTVLSAVSSPELKRSARNVKEGQCPVDFEDVWIGISGCDTPLDQRLMSALLSPFFGRSVVVQNDALLLGGALLSNESPWGIAVIAGTGSITVVLEVDEEGTVIQSARRGGHGYILGDDGSAYDVGRCAIRAAVDDFDGGTEVSGGLADKIRWHFGVQETGELLGKVHELDSSLEAVEATNAQKLRISDLARTVIDALDEGDPLAVEAVNVAVGPLAHAIVHLNKQLADRPLPNGKKRDLKDATLVCGGGCIRQEAYRSVLLRMCAEKGVEFGTVSVMADVAGGAALGLVDRSLRQ